MNSSNVIKIKNIIDLERNEYLNYKDSFVVSRVRDLSLFKHPCHLDAVTIMVCLEGEIEVSINLKKYVLRKNSVLLNYSENIIELHKAEKVHAYAIIISSDYVNQFSLEQYPHQYYSLQDYWDNEVFNVPNNEIKVLGSYLSIFRRSLTSDALMDNELIKQLSRAFFTHILLLQKGYCDSQKNENKLSKNSYAILKKFNELVSSHHAQERKLSFYADKMCITSKYLSQVIEKTSGKKATDWISEYVVIEAKSLLRYSGKNIQEISQQLNFPSQSSFGKYFKSQTGLSPTEFMSKCNDN